MSLVDTNVLRMRTNADVNRVIYILVIFKISLRFHVLTRVVDR